MTSATAAPTTISIDDFMTGLVASLAQRGIRSVSIRDAFYASMREAFEEFQGVAEASGYEVDFVINTHPVHGDSPTLRQAITQAVQRDLVSLDNPVYLDMRMKISRDYADEYLADLPGGPDLYAAMTTRFLKTFAERTNP